MYITAVCKALCVSFKGYTVGRREAACEFQRLYKRLEAACEFQRLYKGLEAACEVQRLCKRLKAAYEFQRLYKRSKAACSFRSCIKGLKAACKFQRLYKEPEAACKVQRLCLIKGSKAAGVLENLCKVLMLVMRYKNSFICCRGFYLDCFVISEAVCKVLKLCLD